MQSDGTNPCDVQHCIEATDFEATLGARCTFTHVVLCCMQVYSESGLVTRARTFSILFLCCACLPRQSCAKPHAVLDRRSTCGRPTVKKKLASRLPLPAFPDRRARLSDDVPVKTTMLLRRVSHTCAQLSSSRDTRVNKLQSRGGEFKLKPACLVRDTLFKQVCDWDRLVCAAVCHAPAIPEVS